MDEEKKQEMIMRASLLQQQAQEVERHLDAIVNEIKELQSFREGLEKMNGTKSKEMFNSFGKGVYVKSSIVSEDFLVDVGAGVLVKKSSAETQKVVEGQIKKLNEARHHLIGKLEIYQRLLQEMVNEVRHLEHEH